MVALTKCTLPSPGHRFAVEVTWRSEKDSTLAHSIMELATRLITEEKPRTPPRAGRGYALYDISIDEAEGEEELRSRLGESLVDLIAKEGISRIYVRGIDSGLVFLKK